MKRHPLIAFLGLTLVISWGLWIPMVLAARGAIHLPVALTHVHIWGAFGPGLAALIVTGANGGVNALQRLFARLLIWRVGGLWYLAALCLPSLISLLTTALHTMFGGDAPDFRHLPIRDTALWPAYQDYRPWAMVLPLFLHQLVGGTGLGEELGWRGFALPRLQERFDALHSSGILALAWALWTLPLAFVGANPQIWWAAFFLLLGALPGAILSTWLFNNTRGSLLVTLLFNNAVKVTGLLLAAALASPAVALAPYWLAALVVVAVAGAARLSRQPLDANCRGDAAGTTEPGPAAAH